MKEQKTFNDNIKSIEIFSIIFIFISIFIFLLWACIPLINNVYFSYNQSGHVIDDRFSFAWTMSFMLSLNILLPMLLTLTLLDPRNTSRGDFLYMFVMILVFINGIIMFSMFMYWLFWVNTGFAAGSAFNDYRYCCVYYEKTQYCSNTAFPPCSPAVTQRDLGMSDVFIWHWAFSAAFLFLTFGYMIVHKLIHESGVINPHNEKNKKNEGLIVGLVFIFLSAIVYALWAGFPLLNTLHLNGYPRFPIPPIPNTFETLIYGYHWWLIWCLGLNLLPILTFLLALINNKFIGVTKLHYWVTTLVAFIDISVFFLLLLVYIFDCGYNYSGGSLCNSYSWCCSFFSNAPTICPNITPCPNPINEHANAEFFMHLIMSMVFGFMNVINVWITYRMKQYGIFYKIE